MSSSKPRDLRAVDADELRGVYKQSWVEAVLRGLLANDTLVAQAKANTPAQFLGSPDLRDSVGDYFHWTATAAPSP